MIAEASETKKYWMALSSVKNVGAKTAQLLVEKFGSPEKVLSAPAVEIARMLRINKIMVYDFADAKKNLSKYEKFIAQMSKSGIDVLCPDDYEYPCLLKLIEDPPSIIYKKGTLPLTNEATIAIVGTRFPTSDGAEAAEKIAIEMANRNFVVVSGLAKGVDTAAHKGALKAGGKTIAILGSGLKMVYPRENCQLAENICLKGAVVSECHPNESVSKQRLIQRNRIISGTSLGVILVEPEKGAWNAAQWALKQSRHIFLYDPKNEKKVDRKFIIHGSLFFLHEVKEAADAVLDRFQTAKITDLKKNDREQSNLF